MTKRTTSPARQLPAAYEPGVFYAVRLARRAEWKGKTLSPAHPLTLKGVVCTAIADDIAEARVASDVPG